VALQTDVFTRTGVERVVRYAFEQARGRRKNLTSITKSNASPYTFVFWDEVVKDVAREYPDVTVRSMLVDAAAAAMITRPESFDVLVASNLFGDILTDIGAVIQGSMGLAAIPASSTRYTARRLILPARVSPIRSGRSGPAR
jgi:tartrate dehydrogenase/decarboxylase/D-malate dehydrogenase